MLITHNALPLKRRLDLVNEERKETEEENWRRAEGGIMSLKAERRSETDSPSSSISDSLEISDSGICGAHVSIGAVLRLIVRFFVFIFSVVVFE